MCFLFNPLDRFVHVITQTEELQNSGSMELHKWSGKVAIFSSGQFCDILKKRK